MLTGGSDVSATPSLMPTGTVTFLLTDVEGSSRRWEATPELMHDAIPAVLYTFVHWTSVGRITPAAVLLGYLERHDVHHSIGVAARQHAADVIHQHPEASASIAIGRSLDRDELVAYTLEHFSRADLDVVAGPE